nr:reverse transcriptase domain-containing protein [Tanacetum cinerariifolium]
KSKVRQSRAKAVVAKVNSNSSTPSISSDVVKLKDMVRALLLDKKNQSSSAATSPTPASIKAVKSNCVTCGDGQIRPPGFPPVQNNQNNFNQGNNFTQKRGGNFNQSAFNQSQLHRPQEDLKGITTRNGVAYNGPTIPTPSKVVKQGTEVTKDPVQTPSPQSTAHVQPPVTQSETPVSEPIVALVSAPMPNLKPSIPYPSRRDNERRR